ncbi:MFS transporter [Leptospira sp. WS58.C1]|uniref:MFS transporter n=1 Tax=Leptospira TaxID=171 RepID=UPI0002BFAA7C|nr:MULTISPECIES: MFS transporter [unclassified Leptospira]EMK01878.1 transporter, major facilitator domain protein [Leptospira sp. B5-022]MCR1795173.1 MFS transporter [Leptospira sp. id769339]
MKFTFSKYQIFVVALLAFIQFTVVLDFMILSPLGVQVMEQLKISTSKFGLVVSAYAFSAGISGILAAGFADRFDRKKMLLFFYGGFVLGTVLCGIAPNYEFLLFARIVTGLFGGVIASISFAIIADLFPLEVRGRVMGLVMTAFAASQVFGLPIGVFFSNIWGWQSPFWMIALISGLVGIAAIFNLQPIVSHLSEKTENKAIKHLVVTAGNPNYLPGFLAIMLLATGGYMLMPFGSAFSVHNLGISLEDLPLVYFVTGIVSMAAGPLIGRAADKFGKYSVFLYSSLITCMILFYYTSMGISPLWFVILINSALFIVITGRVISANALNSAMPELRDRGAYMAISSSLQQLSGGIASYAAGLIVIQTPSGYIQGYPNLGYVVITAILVTAAIMYKVNEYVQSKQSAPVKNEPEAALVSEI